jgi:hypothetical protein
MAKLGEIVTYVTLDGEERPAIVTSLAPDGTVGLGFFTEAVTGQVEHKPYEIVVVEKKDAAGNVTGTENRITNHDVAASGYLSAAADQPADKAPAEPEAA